MDADEIWIWNAGAPLTLNLSPDGTATTNYLLGPDFRAGEHLQHCVPRLVWQAARSNGAWSLVSCVVAPAFRFEGFTLARPGWRPGDTQ